MIIMNRDRNHDAGVRDKKSQETNIGEGELQIRSQNRLQSPAYSPKISDLKPPFPAGQQGDDDRDHRPIAELKGQRLLPGQPDRQSEVNFVTEIVKQSTPASSRAMTLSLPGHRLLRANAARTNGTETVSAMTTRCASP